MCEIKCVIYYYSTDQYYLISQKVSDCVVDAFRFFSKKYAVHFVCMHEWLSHSKGKDQPGKVANPARGQMNRENEYFPVPVRA